MPRKKLLNGKTGFLPSPCLAIAVKVNLKPKEKKTIDFYVGCAKMSKERQLLSFTANNQKLYSDVWKERFCGLQVKTPDSALDLLVNGWLLYQVLSCRMYARTAFYQCGGAYGFRDQLQDSVAFLYTQPEITMWQILHHAARQFKEGDVLHWWHEGEKDEAKGVRTRISDDLLWLAYAVSRYISVTTDHTILEEKIPYLAGEELHQDAAEHYISASSTCEAENLYIHVCRALRRSMTKGAHGLPLMGSGDWNDGMNEIGKKGKGESVWLGWFLSMLLKPVSYNI